MRLAVRILARALQRATVFEIENYAVGKLLPVLIGDVGGVELGEGKALC